jgi:hypothetical protein
VATGFSADDLKVLSRVAGSAVVATDSGSVSITLPARHSTLLKFAGADFDRLRRSIQIK